MEYIKTLAAAVSCTVISIAGPFACALGIEYLVPGLGYPALGIALIACPVIGCKSMDLFD